MPKRWIRSEEWYAVYELTRSQPYDGGCIELSDEELRDIRQVFKDFQRVQRRLERVYESSQKKAREEQRAARMRAWEIQRAAMTPEEIEAEDLSHRIDTALSFNVLDDDSAFLADHGYTFVPDNHPSGHRGRWVLNALTTA